MRIFLVRRGESAANVDKELHKKSGSEMQEMMRQKGTTFDEYPNHFRRGTFIRRELVGVELSDADYAKIPEKHHPDRRLVNRHRMVEMDMPSFGTATNRVGVIFDGEQPATLQTAL